VTHRQSFHLIDPRTEAITTVTVDVARDGALNHDLARDLYRAAPSVEAALAAALGCRPLLKQGPAMVTAGDSPHAGGAGAGTGEARP
jgi:hypothetical protein